MKIGAYVHRVARKGDEGRIGRGTAGPIVLIPPRGCACGNVSTVDPVDTVDAVPVTDPPALTWEPTGAAVDPPDAWLPDEWPPEA
jgi:hypothetical protein